jgi:hypothetical protein
VVEKEEDGGGGGGRGDAIDRKFKKKISKNEQLMNKTLKDL